jgi:hypothetical protein
MIISCNKHRTAYLEVYVNCLGLVIGFSNRDESDQGLKISYCSIIQEIR